MARPSRNKIKFDRESLENLFQEVYNDSYNLRGEISALLVGYKAFLAEKDLTKTSIIAKDIANLLTLRENNNKSKIAILKLLTEIVYGEDKKSPDKKNDKDDGESFKTLTDAEKHQLIKDVNKTLFNK